MAHSRAESFNAALQGGGSNSSHARRWTDVASDPNDPRALAHRAATLRQAWRPPVDDRLTFLEERCRGRRVLDIGCVAHDVTRMASGQWLHARLAAAAASCLGIDVLEDGVQHMQALGYDVMTHDLGDGLEPVLARAPFDVIVAGELIEHVEAVDMLFTAAQQLLADDGEMIITTPNPYAPHRVRAARLGIVWENVDHIFYAFPSGIAELCERHGLVLREASTTAERGPRGLIARLKAVKRKVRGNQWMTVGFTSIGRPRVRRVGYGAWGRAIRAMSVPGHRFTGETFIYVIRRS